MDKIDVIAMAADFAQGENGCSFSQCSVKATESYVVDFENNKGEKMHFSFPVCPDCTRHINDQFSIWIPIFCVECSTAGWMLRQGKVSVEDGATAVFSHGCPKCSPEGSKHIWCM